MGVSLCPKVWMIGSTNALQNEFTCIASCVFPQYSVTPSVNDAIQHAVLPIHPVSDKIPWNVSEDGLSQISLAKPTYACKPRSLTYMAQVHRYHLFTSTEVAFEVWCLGV